MDEGRGVSALNDDVTALVAIGRWLQSEGYAFVSCTPATHQRFYERAPIDQERNLRDIFGWNRPFDPELLPADILQALETGGVLLRDGVRCRSAVRYSTLDHRLYCHSGYPTVDEHAVFFGPDTYRFARLIREVMEATPSLAEGCILDVGCGSGAGGLVAHAAAGGHCSLLLSDINPRALLHACANAQIAEVEATFIQSDLFHTVPEPVDFIIANPPYLADTKKRVYRDGGGRLGSGLSLRIAREGLGRLASGGTLLLYTGSCIVAGEDLLRRELTAIADAAGAESSYRELDPDVFGEELALPGYEAVERIAVVGFIATISRPTGRAASVAVLPGASRP